MQILSSAAMLALALGLGGCAGMGHDMHGAHHDAMMGAMSGEHAQANCPGASESQHAPAASGQAQGEHQHADAAPAECPPADAEAHQHGDTPAPN